MKRGIEERYLPENIWLGEGSFRDIHEVGDIVANVERLESSGEMMFVAVRSSSDSPTVVNLGWETVDGIQVRGQLSLSTVDWSDQKRGPDSLVPSTWTSRPARGLRWTFAVEADRPWHDTWRAPSETIFPRLAPWDINGLFSLRGINSIPGQGPPSVIAALWDYVLGMTCDQPTVVTVLAHASDKTAIGTTEGRGQRPLSIARTVSPAMKCRVLQLLVPKTHRREVNRALARGGFAAIPEDGALVLPRQGKGTGTPLTPGQLQSFIPLRDAVQAEWRRPVLLQERQQNRIDALRAEPPASYRDLAARWRSRYLAAVEVRDSAIRAMNEGNAIMNQQQALLRRLPAEFALALQRKADSPDDGQQSGEQEDQSALHQMRAEQLTEDLAAAEALLDEQAETISRLRRRLAATGVPYAETATCQRDEMPDSWEALIAWTQRDLSRIVLGDIAASATPLRGHTAEPSWLRRTWRALRALNAYATTQAQYGVEAVPNFASYLRSEIATEVIPEQSYSARESERTLSHPKFRQARVFPVPRQVDPSGQVLMEKHIRVGSGQPPAPRLHFHDDVVQSLVFVGHIGPHLPNMKTN
ncbi:hypothetical protein ACFVAF_38085 [Streptomyces sp. NPDC057596]|uniref:hypothetical protein n=1 Tax=Streptomyces sp. NPDC057596 TaxID=3346178 RepID=UPI003674BBD4